MKIVILGSGLAGILAYRYLFNHRPIIYSRELAIAQQHKAVMRIRTPDIAMILGCDMQKITVYKSVYFSGKLHTHCDIAMSNAYSLKTTGVINDKSIGDLSSCIRYLMNNDWSGHRLADNLIYGYEFIRVEDGKLVFRPYCCDTAECDTAEFVYTDYDWCISTIPLPLMGKMLGFDDLVVAAELTAKDICVVRMETNIPCTVNQTIYFPEFEFKTYRATLQFGALILETVSGVPSDDEIITIAKLFGFPDISVFYSKEISIQKNAKIGIRTGNSEQNRKRLIWNITNKYNIFCFGRYGVWRPLRADHLLSDVEKIKFMISMHDNNYEFDKAKGGIF